MEILKLENIVKTFGENHVLNGVNLTFNEGKIYTLVGGNGTGKSTLYNLITGFLRADKGTITYKCMRNLWGATIAAAVLIILPEALRFIGMPSNIAANVCQILYGLALVFMMFKYSKGFISKPYSGQENEKFR